MKNYRMIWEIKDLDLTHDVIVDLDCIFSKCAYCYDCWASDILPGIVDNMKKGQTVSHTFPNGDKMTVTALEDIFLPF